VNQANPTATPLAIVGIDCLFPKAGDKATFWTNLRDGVDAITDVPASHWKPEEHFDPDPAAPDMVYAKRGGFLDAVDVSPMQMGIAPRDIEATDTTQLLALHVAARALEDAGYGPDGKSFDRGRTSVILGVTGALELVIPLGARLGHPLWRKALRDAGVDEETAQDVVERISAQYVPWQENSFPGLLGNVAAGRIANRLDLHGTNCVVDAACASSLSALHLAALELEAGRSDLVLAGGVDTFNDVFMYTCFSKTPALSKRGDARPFDKDADGTILGEGVGIVVLKRLADAERDGDRIYAVVRGIGSSSDGKGQAIYAPDSEGQARALRSAYRIAGVDPSTVQLVEGHGTGTRVGDATEIGGLTSVYDPDGSAQQPWCALGSVKSMIGHTKAAAGVAGLIKVALALHHRVLPPTLKVDAPNEAMGGSGSPFYVATRKRPWLPPSEHRRRAGVSAFGFGGSNFHCVLEESSASAPAITWDGQTELLAFGAPDRASLQAAVEAFETPSSWAEVRRRAWELRQAFASDAACRLTVVIRHDAWSDLKARLATAARAIVDDARPRWSTPQGIAFGEGTPGRLGALLPGQGAQAVDMLADLACSSDLVRATIESALADLPDVAATLYPAPAFDDATKTAQQAALTATEVAQPALGAVSLGAAALLGHFGVRPDAAIGHSYGELTALCLAGRLSVRDLARVSRRRGELMAAGDGDRGSMLAVFATQAEVRNAIEAAGLLDVTVANHNAPRQIVVSGPTAAIEAAAAALEQAGLRAKRLNVAAAFHSPLVSDAREPFAATLADVSLSAGTMPVYANVSGTRYPEVETDAKALLADQLASPVQFVRGIETMVADGVTTFVEIGPGRRLGGLVREIAADADVQCLAIDASSGRRPGMADVAAVLASLAAWGHPVDLRAWEPEPVPAPTSAKLTISVCGANAKPKATSRPPRAPAPPRQSMSKMPDSSSPMPSPSAPAAPAADAAQVTAALQATQANLAALMQLQQQTAELHRRFLEGQQQATQAFGTLVAQQQALMGTGAQPVMPVMPVMPTAPLMPTAPVMPAAPVMPTAPLMPAAPVVQPAPVAPVAATPSAPAPQPAPVAASPTAATPAPATTVGPVLLEIVADKTGYPMEMLELSMGLDADLGIDSIKRVEILSALRERLPDARPIGPEQLGELQTLGQIVEYLEDGAAPSAAAPAPTSAPAPSSAATDVIATTLLEIVADKTGYPVEMLELPMGLDADLGIDSIKRVEILSTLRERLPEAPAIGPDQLGVLSTLGEIVEYLGGSATVAAVAPKPAAAKAPEPAPKPADAPLDRYAVAWSMGTPKGDPIRPLDGPVVVRGADALTDAVAQSLTRRGLSVTTVAPGAPLPTAFSGLVLVPADPTPADVAVDALATVRDAAPRLVDAAARGGAWLASITRLGGDFGIAGLAGDRDPNAGALAGLMKTAAREWPSLSVHALDVPPTANAEVLDALFAAAFEGAPVELGHTDRLGTPTLVPGNEASGPGVELDSDDVVLVSGGARGVTASVAVELARRGQPTLVLLGRSPAPEAEPTWLAPLRTEAEVKHALVDRASSRPSPRDLDRSWQAIAAAREIRTTLETIEATGARVTYRSVDVRDGQAVRALVGEVTEELGPVTALIHGAGVLADKRITDKTDDDVRRVWGTKVEGAHALLAALEGAPLRAIAMFSSSTARFGRVGQADYAMANEVLNKLADQLAVARPQTRVVAFGWGPWDGGMVTPGLAKLFASEGVTTIGLQAGARFFADELARRGTTELVIVGPGSSIPVAPVEHTATSAEHPTVFERRLGVEDHPFLASHVLGGKAVLPTVMMVEWFAHAALAEHPGLRFVGVDDLRIFRGVRLNRTERLAVRVEAGPAKKQDGQFVVPVALCSGGNNGHRVLHGQAHVVLAARTDEAPSPEMPRLPAFADPVDRVYDRHLFHGEAFRGLASG